VTTEHMHHEHSDVDTSVVEYPSALETTINPTTNETATSVEAYGEGDIPSPKLTASAPTSEKANQESPDSQEVLPDFAHGTAAPLEMVSTSVSCSDNENAPTELSPAPTLEEDAVSGTIKEEQQAQEITEIPEIPSSADPQEESVSGAVLAKADVEIINFQQKLAQLSSLEQESQEQSVTETTPDNASGQIEAVPAEVIVPFIATETEEKPLLETKAEEIRPFTDFIEEFRLAEVARLQTTLHESQVETFILLSSVESAFAAANAATDSAEEAGNSVAQSEQSISTPSVPTEEVSASSLRVDENGLGAPTVPGERAVSPLLRPATRLRVPRHGTGRHHREEQATVAETPVPVQSEQTGQITPSEPPVVTTPPKPARRYRFDRPSPATTVSTSGTNGVYGLNGSVPATTNKFTTNQPSAEETRSGVTLAVDLATIGEQAASEITQTIGQPIHKPITAQQAASVENTGITTASPSEQGRRRHAQKEQPTVATPVTQVDAMPIIASASTVEPDVQLEEIAPEDLPPLEYADLQKAHPRRRRRHRSGSNGNTPGSSEVAKSPATPVVPPTPQPQTLMPQIPPTPVPPSVGASSYSIVSGYTVSQMNQGNDVAGPFLGPEPSPARGSAFTRDGRTTARPGSQRTPASAPVPTSRVGDNGLTPASITQFATIVSQAIETQTDRMVAEFRRLGQAPTNVSVSLPPFPSSERVGVFVDVANLLYSARTLRIAVDFGKLLDFLRGNRRLIRAHAYCPTSPQPGDEQMFLQAVKGLGYRITTKNYKTFSSGAKKADLDLDLCMDVVRLVDGKAVDCVVLLSGDSDFMPMLDYCSDHGVRVEVAAFDEAMSATLRQGCDLFINLSMLDDIRA
jgi:uncharacterized LabA/DUF88 family protein